MTWTFCQEMEYLDLLGRQLKDSLVVEVLEDDDLDVIYSFDRLHENQPDEYWVSAHGRGFQMRFNENQLLDTIFFYIEPDGDFSPCDPSSIGLPMYSSRESARQYAESSGLRHEEGEVDFLGIFRKWIKIDHGAYLHHLEFREGRLHKMTAMLPEQAEQGGGADA